MTNADGIKEQLSYDRMLYLAALYIEWAMESERSAEQVVQLIGMARELRELAWTVGEDWNPPEPERISLVGFMGRFAEETYTVLYRTGNKAV